VHPHDVIIQQDQIGFDIEKFEEEVDALVSQLDRRDFEAH